MTQNKSPNVLFVSLGRSVVGWYRAALPALYMGADWIGIADQMVKTGGVHRRPINTFEDFASYDLVIWQQPQTHEQRTMIRRLRTAGVKVIIEVDDYLHGVRKMRDHDFRDAPAFSKKALLEFERQMSLADGVICSTEYLESKYRKFAKRSWVCKNGLDMGRYEKSRPKHSTVNMGWAGATGHILSFDPLRQLIGRKLEEHANTTFISVGQDFAGEWTHHGNRVLSLPFSSLEIYPNALCMFDIAFAPARESGWYRGKSALRYYEAAALGIPTIGSPVVYGEIEDGKTGFLADTPQEWEEALEFLIVNDDVRLEMGRNAREVALAEFDMNVRVKQWLEVIDEVLTES